MLGEVSALFTHLLVSAPNHTGGLFLLEGSRVFCLGTLQATGLYYSHPLDLLLLADQSSNNTLLITDRMHSHPESYAGIHDVLEVEGQIYTVATKTNSIHCLHTDGSTTQWVYSEVADSWHINCLGVWQGRLVFSAFGEFNEHRGWKEQSAGQGFVQDLLTGERLISGLSMPHSLVVIGDHLLLANSQDQEIHEYNAQGILVRRKHLGGYTRGICIDQGVIYVGLSRGRDPYLGQNKEKAREYAEQTAAIIALDAQTWDELGQVELPSREVYSIVAIPTAEDLNRILLALTEWTLRDDGPLAQRNDSATQQIQTLRQQLAHLTAQHNRLKSSLSWKITAPLRRFKTWLKPLRPR